MSFLNKTNVGWGLMNECRMTEKENEKKRKICERRKAEECLNAQERDSASQSLSDTERGHLYEGRAQTSEGHVKANHQSGPTHLPKQSKEMDLSDIAQVKEMLGLLGKSFNFSEISTFL